MTATTHTLGLAAGIPVELLGATANFASAGRALLSGVPDDLNTHQARYGTPPLLRAGHRPDLLTEIEASGLTGRGGAGFPVAAKWRTARSEPGPRLVVANGAESEALSAKDAALLELRPHLVLDGLACAVQALGAAGGIVWLGERAEGAAVAVAGALAERRAAGVDDVAMDIAEGPDAYVTGESSAIVQTLNGGATLPAFTRHPAARHGVSGRPTVIHNVETLARIGLIAHHGASAVHLSRLVTVASGGVLTVRELPVYATMSQAVLPVTTGWLNDRAPQAVLIGGYGGIWAPWTHVAELSLGQLELTTGVLAAIPAESCGIAETASIIEYLARSSARQCGPCRFGTRALANSWARIAAGEARRPEVERLRRIAGEVEGRGACHLPDGAVALTRSALAVFADDIDRHVRRGGCAHVAGHTALHVPEVSP